VTATTQGATGARPRVGQQRHQGLLSLDGVTVWRRIDAALVAALADVSLDVSPGEIVVIAGGRRSGKTTLLRVSAGIELPQAGVVRVRGRRITGVSGGARARRTRVIGYMPKEMKLVAGKRVVDHIALPLLAERVALQTAIARAHETLDRVGAMDLAAAVPHELTAGQQALVALARALVRRPALLLADEPGAKAEPDDRDRILRLLQSLASESADLGLVVSTRDEVGAIGATRVLSMSDGRLTSARGHGRVIPLPARAR
jgi:ABC-type methionine transport system ATPase subunit